MSGLIGEAKTRHVPSSLNAKHQKTSFLAESKVAQLSHLERFCDQADTSCDQLHFKFFGLFQLFWAFLFLNIQAFSFSIFVFSNLFRILGLFKIVGPFSIVFGLFILHFCIFPILRQGSDVSKTISSGQSYKYFTILIYDPRVVNCLLDWPQQSSFKHSDTQKVFGSVKSECFF